MNADQSFFCEFFQGGGKIYCYANFYCYATVFGPNFREGQKFSGGQTASGGRPPAPCGRSQSFIILNIIFVIPGYHTMNSTNRVIMD